MAPPASSEFLTKLRDERVSLVGRDRILLAPLVYYSALLGQLILVPAGFVTDYASVPRAPLTYWLFGGVGDEAAVVHDFLYEKGLVPRDVADAVYGEALAACGVPAWRRGPMVLAVRLFGAGRYSPAAVAP
jgi:hypothetical protein